ncbi:MAG TPA: methionyl-tRNA formyltransferase [Wolbachia sp.]|jgi:methionyl-tRNA formyltransferase|uniref:methionyl-tRNA formyltransferase n=1 Tax=Wolbachia endosymbiont of Pentalonia nigronervosa TaxID=1301914 RepID=UPI000EE4DB51|nr:methionyl-tRNA formyltransferase [Wolbachia endosymbiont of Pentalonia nigronervosa]MBD0390883.1 methionyl-tRNA formyltransferase [Wolbachia endosymbiont of Pentalonia nigronervosa]HCE59657.1 methionyl-tRNA formyltransferase [Wolbachia sp.]
MKIIFMGSPEFAVIPLKLLIHSQHEVIAVYTRAPKPANRGKKLTETPVHNVAKENNIEVCTVSSLKFSKEQEKFRSLAPDVAVVAAYGLILPREILNIPEYGCINIHPSLLPRWRGAAPIQHTILAGDQETGVSIMQMNEGLDSGPILKQERFSIKESDNYKTLHNKLSELGGHLLLEVLSEIQKRVPIEQDSNYACYADKIKDYRIYVDDTCEVAYRKIKALYPKTFVKIEGKRMRILDADFEVSTLLESEQGKIINNSMHIKLKGGTLIPKVVQMEGKKTCGIEDFIRGCKINVAGKFIE